MKKMKVFYQQREKAGVINVNVLVVIKMFIQAICFNKYDKIEITFKDL